MPVTIAKLEAWLTTASETPNLEFKEAKSQYDKKNLLDYCVAIANERGGHLILGVKNGPPPRDVVGTNAFQNPRKIAEQILDTLRFRVDVDEVSHPNGRVLVFSIPSRPNGTACHHDGRYLMRSGECLVPMSQDQLRRIFDEGKPDWMEEHARVDLTEDDVLELLAGEKYYRLLRSPYPRDNYAVVERLVGDGLVDHLPSGKFAIRRIGALLLANQMSEFPELSRKPVRVAVYTGKSKLEPKLTQIGAKGYAVGFQGLVSFVMAQIPQNEIIRNALRTESKLVPDEVIRELIANAIIHQDFSETGSSIAIDIYENRIDISNPGIPVVQPERFIDCYKSRNERFADFMRRMGICEEKGSGIDRVVQIIEVFQLPAPAFTCDGIRTQVTIFGPTRIDDMDRADRVRACYQHCCLKYVMSERMTNQSLRQRFGLPVSKTAIVSQAIAATVDEKLVKLDEKVGTSRRFARYIPYWA